MKKLLATTFILLGCGALQALPIGNPSEASLLTEGVFWEGHCADPCDPCVTWCDAWSLRIGFYGDYVFNRHLEVDQSHDDSDIEHTEIYTNAAYIAGNLYDRLDIFVTLGATSIFIDTNASAFDATPGNRFVIETGSDFSWSIGARATLWECGCTTLGIEGQYFFANPNVTRLTQAAASSVYVDRLISAKYREWQIGLGLSHRIYMLVPYIGIKWSHAQVDFDNASNFTVIDSTTRLYDLDSKKYFGFAVGTSLVDCERAAVTVEGRFADEKAVYVNGQVRF